MFPTVAHKLSCTVFPIGGHARPFALCELRGHQRNHNTRGKAVAGKPLDVLDMPGVGDTVMTYCIAGFVLDGPACKRLNLLTSRQKQELSRRLKDRRPPNPSAFVMSTVLTYWSTIYYFWIALAQNCLPPPRYWSNRGKLL